MFAIQIDLFKYKRFKDGGCAYKILGWVTLALSSLQVAMQGLTHTRLPFGISVIIYVDVDCACMYKLCYFCNENKFK